MLKSIISVVRPHCAMVLATTYFIITSKVSAGSLAITFCLKAGRVFDLEIAFVAIKQDVDARGSSHSTLTHLLWRKL